MYVTSLLRGGYDLTRPKKGGRAGDALKEPLKDGVKGITSGRTDGCTGRGRWRSGDVAETLVVPHHLSRTARQRVLRRRPTIGSGSVGEQHTQ